MRGIGRACAPFTSGGSKSAWTCSVAQGGNSAYPCGWDVTGRRLTIALLPIALLVLLASCGGDEPPKQADRTTNSSAPNGQDDSSRTNGSDGSAAPTAGSESGGAAPADPPSADQKKTTGPKRAAPEGASPDKNPTTEELQKRVDKLKESLEKDKQSGGGTDSAPAPSPAQPSAGPQVVLYRKSKRVCQTMGLEALANRYGVAPTPEAVASAFANSYPETFRRAVHDGCKSAF